MATYPTIDAHRFLYNLDGTQVGYNNTSSFANGVTAYYNQSTMDLLQNENNIAFAYSGGGSHRCIWFFFPYQKEITHFLLGFIQRSVGTSYGVKNLVMYGSNDTTDGIDGTWTPIVIDASALVAKDNNSWRNPVAVTPPATGKHEYKVVRFYIYENLADIYFVHMYGRKVNGENPNDISFVKADGVTPYTALHDYGSTVEGMVYDTDIYVKNDSTTLSANSVVVAIGGTNSINLTISVDAQPFASSLSIPVLAPLEKKLVRVRNIVGNTPQSLNARNAYVRVTVASWT